MAFLTVSDDSMNINDNVVMFPSIYSSNKHLLEVNQAYIGKIKLEIRKDKNEINIFGSEFVSRYIENCHLIIDGEKKDLCSKYQCTKEQVEIKLNTHRVI